MRISETSYLPQVNTNNFIAFQFNIKHFNSHESLFYFCLLWEDKWINFQKFMLINLEIVSNKFSVVSYYKSYNKGNKASYLMGSDKNLRLWCLPFG